MYVFASRLHHSSGRTSAKLRGSYYIDSSSLGLLGMGLVSKGNSSGPKLLDVLSHCLFYVNMDLTYRLDSGRTFFSIPDPWPSFLQQRGHIFFNGPPPPCRPLIASSGAVMAFSSISIASMGLYSFAPCLTIFFTSWLTEHWSLASNFFLLPRSDSQWMSYRRPASSRPGCLYVHHTAIALLFGIVTVAVIVIIFHFQ